MHSVHNFRREQKSTERKGRRMSHKMHPFALTLIFGCSFALDTAQGSLTTLVVVRVRTKVVILDLRFLRILQGDNTDNGGRGHGLGWPWLGMFHHLARLPSQFCQIMVNLTQRAMSLTTIVTLYNIIIFRSIYLPWEWGRGPGVGILGRERQRSSKTDRVPWSGC